MEKLTANEAKTNFGQLLMKAQSEPVQIDKNGKPAVVVMSTKDYQELKLQALRTALTEGDESPDALDFSIDKIKAKLDANI
jgi:prevent-host-death family protein